MPVKWRLDPALLSWLVPGWSALVSCTFCFCSLDSGNESGGFSTGRVMVLGLRKLKSVRQHRRGRAGLPFVASIVKAQQGEPPRQFVRSATLHSQGAAAPQHRGGCSELHQIKSTQRQKLHSDTVTALIYPACLWVSLPLKQLAAVFLLFFFSPDATSATVR